MERKVLQSSRVKAALQLLISLGISLAIFHEIREGGHSSPAYWLGLVFCGLCTCLVVIGFVRPVRLVLDAEGFTVDGALRRKTYLWREVTGFFVVNGRGGRLVGYNFDPQARPRTGLLQLNRSLSADAMLGDIFTGSPDALVAELNARRNRALDRSPPAEPSSDASTPP